MSKNNISELIPKGTIAKIKMTIKPGGYHDQFRIWTNGYATHNPDTGSIYLNVLFTVSDGEYAGYKIFGRIGLYSKRNILFSRIGYLFTKSILCSAYGISLYNHASYSKFLSRIKSCADIDGIEFLALIDEAQDKQGHTRNIIRRAITCDQKEYKHFMSQNL